MTRSKGLLASILGLAALAAWILSSRTPSLTRTQGTGELPESVVPGPGPNAKETDLPAASGAADPTRLASLPGGHAPGATRTTETRAASTSVRVTGRVVDDRRRPVAGAVLTARLFDAPEASTTSHADGGFEIETTLTGPATFAVGSVRAVYGAGRASLGAVYQAPPAADVGTLELAPACSIVVRVVDEGRAVPDAALLLWTIRDGAGLVRIGDGVTDRQGEATLGDLPPCTLLLLATGPNGRRARATVRISDAAPEPVMIDLKPERSLDVLVRDAEGKGIPGATVELAALREDERGNLQEVAFDPSPTLPSTDVAGRTTIRGLCEGDRVQLTARAAGYGPVRDWTADSGYPSGLAEIRLARTRTVSWPLIAGERPTPASGTVVTLRRWPYRSGSDVPPTARVEGARLVVDGLSEGEVHAIATAPDGSLAEVHLAKPDALPPETSFVRPRRIEVKVTDPAGRGVPGVSFLPRCRLFGEADWPPERRTDAEGIATFQGLPPREFRVIRWSAWGFFESVGEGVQLADGDAQVEARVGDEHDLEVHVRVDGEARLPSGIECHVHDALELRSEEDPARGILRIRARPWTLSGAGSLQARGIGIESSNVEFTWAKDGPTVVSVDLHRSGTLVAHVARRAGLEFDVKLERKDTEYRRGWVGDYSPSAGDPRGPRLRYTDLSPGEYRLRDWATGLVSETVVVRAGGNPIDISLDLSTAYEVSGRVVAPEGYEAGWARVETEGQSIDVSGIDDSEQEPAVGRHVEGEDGTFRLLVPGGRPIVLKVTHPELVPDREEGAVTVNGPRDDVVLKLSEGPRATFRAVPPPGMPLKLESHFLDGTLGTALLLTPGAAPKAVLRRGFRGEPPDFRFSGYVPGSYDLFLDAPPFAPKTLRDVKLGAGKTELGEIAFERGSTVTVRLRSSEGKPAPSASITAWQNAAPAYFRNQGRGPDAFRVRGLAAGHFTIQVTWTDAAGQSRDANAEIDVDGRSDLVLDVDVR